MNWGDKGHGIRSLLAGVITAAVLSGVLAPLSVAAPAVADSPGFDAGNIVDDASFFNSTTMSIQDIQAFLDARVPNCASVDASLPCLKSYSETTTTIPATPMCGEYVGASNESAATIIFKSARSCGINPQVILVTLQKEQALVTSTAPTVSKYRHAMGALCPDSSACDPAYYGFFRQVQRGTYLLKRYTQPAGTGPGTEYDSRFDLAYPVGQTSAIKYHPNTSCGTKSVFVANQATHVLYVYTPYTPNQPALDAAPGIGDSCSSYGNRNFYNTYNAWFGTGRSAVSGTLLAEGRPSVPIVGAWVSAYRGGVLAGSSQTNAAGQFLVSGLEPGDYTLSFPNAGNGNLVPEWWSDQPGQASAQTFTVAASGVVTGKNAVLENPTFADVTDPWSPLYTDIEWMASSGVSLGTAQPSGKPLYKPIASVSRQAMAQFLYRLSGDSFSAPAEQSFADVDPDSLFYVAIEWMAANGISTGTPQPSGLPLFAPNNAVSRQAMAQFLARFSGVDPSTPPASQSFADVPLDSPVAGMIGWMAASGISTGTPQPSGLPLYKPRDAVSRQAMAAFLHRLSLLQLR